MQRFFAIFSVLVYAQAHSSTPRLGQLGLVQMDAASLASAAPKPMFTEETMPKVSPTLQCVMSLSAQYFIIYTLLAIVRTCNQFDGFALLGPQRILETACTTVTYAPMLSVLFLAARMRAIQLSQGQTEKYKVPQWWVQWAMYGCVYAVLAQVMLVLLIPVFTREFTETHTDENGDLDMSKVQVGGACAKLLTLVRYIIMIALYGGFTVVIVGIYKMTGPMSYLPVSPAVRSTIILTVTFFAVYLLVALTKSGIELCGRTEFLTKLEGTLTLAKYTVNFCPMLAILFIATRMRALQMDPDHGNPQPWAQKCFYLCAGSVVVQTFLVVVMPFLVSCECKEGASESDVIFVMKNPCVAVLITIIRYLAILSLYGGFTAVIVSVFLITHPHGAELTPPISPAMQCVMNLTVQYFTIYLVLFLAITLKQFTSREGVSNFLSKTISVFDGAQKTVMFAPMLSMLFIGARMRALQLTRAQDGTIPTTAGPQTWVQDGMFLATWSVLAQLMMVILVPICTGTGKPEMDHSGNVVTPEGSHRCVGFVIETVRYVCLLAMYGGVVTVMIGVYMMTPETLPPYSDEGSLVPEIEVAGVGVGGGVPKPVTPPTAGGAL